MANKREILEAQAFHRRRLLTAFVSGAPGGREVEPVRPSRAVVAGIGLAVLLVAGFAVAGIVAPRTPTDWLDPGLVLAEESGAPYVVLHEQGEQAVLRPVVNITSARLLVGSERGPTTVPQREIDEHGVGEYVGVADAPPSLPGGAGLVDAGWTACVGPDDGVVLDLAPRTATPRTAASRASPRTGFVVSAGAELFLIARARPARTDGQSFAYRLPADGSARSRLLHALGLPQPYDARRVPLAWLRLFPAGTSLTRSSFSLPGAGDPIGYQDRLGGLAAAVGELVVAGDQRFLLQVDGPAILDPFALAVYRAVADPREHHVSGVRAGAVRPVTAQDWPDALLQPHYGDHCAILDTAPDTEPVVALATGSGGATSPDEMAPHDGSVRVAPGAGAHYVTSAGGATSAEFLVDGQGRRHRLEGDAAELLGYAEHVPRVVPRAWSDLFADGTTLSQRAALCGPGPAIGDECG